MTKHVLVCRPQPDAERTANRLRKAGYVPHLAPMLEIHPTGQPCPLALRDIDALVVTSRQAVPFLNGMEQKPAYAVGQGTQAALHQAGFTRLRSANGFATGLSAAIPFYVAEDGLPKQARLLWPSAAKPAFDMVAALDDHGLSCTRWIVYQAQPATDLAPATMNQLANGTIGTVLLTSPRIAATFAALTPPLPETTRLLCFSANVRATLSPALQPLAEVANQPNEEALLALL